MAKSRVRFSVEARALPRGRVASSEAEVEGLAFLGFEPDAEEEEAAEGRFVDAFEEEPAMTGMDVMEDDRSSEGGEKLV